MKKLLLWFNLLIPMFTCAQKFSRTEVLRYQNEAQAVTIIRDNWGVPHIYSNTDAGAVFGLMYAQCEENFKGIERNYLYQFGRQSEVDGEKTLFTDLQLQMIADTADAIRDYIASPLWFKKLMNAYADGINYYLYKHPEVKPLVFNRFKPWYALMFTDGSVAATETGGITLDETKKFYGSEDHAVAAVPAAGDEVFTDREIGSNGFALAPSHTLSGHAMLYINPHVPFYFRMEVQVVSAEGLNAYGAVTWGQFFIYQGFNQHCGWMHTSSSADVADLYAEKVSQKDGKWYYEYDGKLKLVRERKLVLSVSNDTKVEQRDIIVYYTHHGPVLGSRDGRWLALKANNRSLKALLESWLITKANTLAQYKKAMNLLSNGTNNTVYADDKGNIIFWYGNYMPRRDAKLNWALPVDGSTSATEYKGLHSLNEIVQVQNPATGWIQNCNSTPFTCSGTSSPDKNKYPAYMAPDGQNYRGVEAAKLLEHVRGFTLDSLTRIGYTRYLSAFDVLVPALMKAYGVAPDSVRLKLESPVCALYAWDRNTDTASVATTLAVEWGTRVLQALPRPKTDAEATYQTRRVEEWLKQASSATLLQLFDASVQSLQARYGSWKIKWGDINRYQRPADGTTFSDEQPSIPVGLTGSQFGQLPSFQSRTVNTKKRYGYSGNSFIAAVEFGPKVKAKTVITGGEAFDAKSAHFTDEAQMYIDGKFKDVLFYKADVLKHAEKTYHPGN